MSHWEVDCSVAFEVSPWTDDNWEEHVFFLDVLLRSEGNVDAFDQAAAMTDWKQILPNEPRPYGLPVSSADHAWQETTRGRVCLNCGARWADAVGVTEDDIAAGTRKACYGAHNPRTHAQMKIEKDFLWDTIVEAAGRKNTGGV